MHQMQSIGDGIEYYSGSGVDAGSLAHGSGQAIAIAGHREAVTFLLDVPLPVLEDLDDHFSSE
jgi:hypothetical protein